MRRAALLTIAALTLALAACGPAAAAAPKQPKQPKSGPGGADLSYRGTVAKRHAGTDPARDYWTFAPSRWRGRGKAPQTVPVVIFVHGYGGIDPKFYRPWIDHLARKGNLVIFPNYQANLRTPPAQYTDNAIASIKAALAGPLAAGKPRPRLSRGALYVGHSYGGVVATNLAARAATQGLPKPNALFAVNPFYLTIDASLATLPPDIRMVCMVGNVDTLVGRLGCDTIFARTTALPAKRRNYVWMFSDNHGKPSLTADHRAPTGKPDTLDYRGFWKIADGLRDCAQLRKHCDYGFGGTRRQRSLGSWSDGKTVRRLQVTLSPPACPKGSKAKGC